MANSFRLAIAGSLERVGGGLEQVLREKGWHFDAIDRTEGKLIAGKRGWFGYRKLAFSLEAQGPNTLLHLDASGVRTKVIRGVFDAVSERLGLPVEVVS